MTTPVDTSVEHKPTVRPRTVAPAAAPAVDYDATQKQKAEAKALRAAERAVLRAEAAAEARAGGTREAGE